MQGTIIDDLFQGHFAGQHLSASHPEDQHGAQSGGEAHRRRVGRPGQHDLERALAQVVGAPGKTQVFVRLAAEGLDLADALQIVHEQRIHGAGGEALGSIAAMRSGGVPESARGQQGQRNEGEPGQNGIAVDHEAQHAHDAEHRHCSLLGAVNEHTLDRVHVFQHTGHEVA